MKSLIGCEGSSSSTPLIPDIPFRTITTAVRERLIMEILFSDKYKPGKWINESVIAQELNVSKAPIRESLRELATIGLVEIVPHKGARITEFTDSDMDEIYGIKYKLEEGIFKDIIIKDLIKIEDLSYLESIITDMDSVVSSHCSKKEMLRKYLEKDLEFHKYLWYKSSLKWTIRILENIYLLLILGMYKFLIKTDINQVITYHKRIINYIKEKDVSNLIKYRLESYYSLRKHNDKY